MDFLSYIARRNEFISIIIFNDRRCIAAMSGKFSTCFISLLLALGFVSVPAHARTGSESYVVGRLTGTLYRPPHSLLGNSPSVGGDRGSVEIKGFRLVRVSDGKAFLIRPLLDGYFQQSLPPGEYSLVRQRRDRPSYKEEDRIRILPPFNVPESSLVNLGTLEIVLQGKPEQTMFSPSHKQGKGTYLYRYRYERSPGEEALLAPLGWFRQKETAAASSPSRKDITIESLPTGEADSSRFTLRRSVFRPLLLDRD